MHGAAKVMTRGDTPGWFRGAISREKSDPTACSPSGSGPPDPVPMDKTRCPNFLRKG